MQKNTLLNSSLTYAQRLGKPTPPQMGRNLIMDKKTSDPSSVHQGCKYPIPSFFEYRVKPKELENL